MRLSEDKVSHLSHLLVEGAEREGLATFPDRGRALRLTKEILGRYVRLDDEVDEAVRRKLVSYSRSMPEGSREWEILYRKHFDEEMKKRWR